jgi:hypothetical protein
VEVQVGERARDIAAFALTADTSKMEAITQNHTLTGVLALAFATILIFVSKSDQTKGPSNFHC